MKLVLLFVLCLSVYCICAVRVREWGSVKGYTNFRTEQVVMKERNGKTVTRFVKYPKHWWSSPKFTLRAIRYYDYESEPANTTIVKGGLGEEYVQFKIKSQPGHAIKSIVEFYGEPIETHEDEAFMPIIPRDYLPPMI